MPLTIIREDLTRVHADAIVNTANPEPVVGAGTDAAVYAAAGYEQLELEAVADNKRAVALYKSEGFVVYGSNPRGFWSRLSGWQTLTLMRLELDGSAAAESGEEEK